CIQFLYAHLGQSSSDLKVVSLPDMTHIGEDDELLLPIRVIVKYNGRTYQKSENIAPILTGVERRLLYSPFLNGAEAPRLNPLVKSSGLKRHGLVKNDWGTKAILSNTQNHNACSRTLLAVYDPFNFVQAIFEFVLNLGGCRQVNPDHNGICCEHPG